jgi:hypothetical protein
LPRKARYRFSAYRHHLPALDRSIDSGHSRFPRGGVHFRKKADGWSSCSPAVVQQPIAAWPSSELGHG